MCSANSIVRLTALTLAFLGYSLSANAQETPSQVMHRHVRPAVTNHLAAYVGPLAEETRLQLAVVLPLRNQAALASLLQRLYDPSSPDYRHFLSVAQFTGQFGPTEQDYAAVAGYLRSYGLTTEAAPANRLIVPVRGSVAQINAAFNLKMNVYQHPVENRTFFSPDREPSLRLSVPIAHITGLDNYSLPHHLSRRLAGNAVSLAVNGSGPGGSYLGSDMRAAYYGGTTLDGTGQSVGLVEFGGYDPADVTLTFANAGQTTNVPVNNVLLDGAITGSGVEDGEEVLDIAQAIGMAPGLSQVRVYIGAGQDDANILNSMASENIAKELSCSWSWVPADPTTDDVFFEEMAAQGQSFFAASGDSGAFDAAISPYFYPGEDDYVTAVGGTHLTTSGPGGTWVSETVWNSEGAGSGGGISPANIPIPSYQNGLANSGNGGSSTLRNVPDVAMEGDWDNYACEAQACSGGWAGTSFAAPRWAGFMALVNQQAVEAGTAPSGGIGFLNPPLYQLAQGANVSSDLHDVVSGNNQTENQPVWFSAVAGYDLTTGWGSANGQSLIDDLAGPQVPGFWLTSSLSTVDVNPGASGSTPLKITDAGGFTGMVNLAVTSTLPIGVTASFASNPVAASDTLSFSVDNSVAQQNIPVTVTGTSGSLTQSTSLTLSIHTPTFALSDSPNGLTLSPGASASSTIAVIPEYGFTGNVSLAIAGLPSGVTASFSPVTTSGTSTLTLSASSSATGGSATLTITGTSGSLSATTTLALLVKAPSFTLFAGSPVSVGQGSSASTYVQVDGQYGFNGSVNLAATNLPVGVTASFSTNPATNLSSVTFTASSSTPVGQSSVTITGTSGALTASTSIVLNIMQPTFTLLGPGNQTIGQGSSLSTYVDVTDEYGFNGSVRMSVSGLPSGVTAIWGPNPTASNTQLYLYATSSVTPGQYSVTITGTSGAITATTSFTLTVAVPTFTLLTGGTATVGQGANSYSYVDVQRQYGFSGTVTLSISGLPSGVTASISPNPATNTVYNSSVTFQASASATPGQYPLTITGVSGSQTVTGSMTLVVAPPTFSLSSSGSVNLGQGSSGTASVFIYPAYGFTGSVSLAVSGLPSGVTAAFSPNPTTGSVSTLTLTAASNVTVGQYPLTITGTAGSLTQTAMLTLNVGVQSFSLSAYGVTVGQGQTSSTAVYMNTAYGFNSPVTLSVSGLPSGATASFPTNPTTSYYNQLNFNVGSSVPAGQYPLTITGTAGSLIQTTTMTLTVGAPSFTLSAAGYPTIGQGSTGTSYVYVNAQNGFTGSVDLSISGLPSGVTATFGTNPTTYSSSILFTVANSAVIGSSTLTITGTSGSLTQTSTMTLTVAAPTFSLYGPYSVSVNQGAGANSSVTVSPQYGFTGNVTLSASGLPAGVTATFSPNPTTGSSTVTVSASSTAAAGTTTFTITGTSGNITQSMQAQVVVNAASYSITAAPDEVFVAPGGAGKSTISVVPVNGFSSGVSLSASGLPAGVTAAFSPATDTTSSTLTLTASSTAAAGSSTVIVTGTSEEETASAPLQLIITSGAGSATSTTLAMTAGGTAITTVPMGTTVTATATVTAGSSPVTAGQVYLCNATAAYCDSVHQLATAQLNNNGNAVFRFVPGIGTHTYKAVFVNTTTNAGSISAPSPLTVTASLPTTTTLSQSGSAGNYTLTATVTGQGLVAPSGNVSFVDTSSGNAVLASSPAASSTATLTETVAQTIPVGSSPAYMVSGDFNGDGILDLAVVNTGSSTVSILLGSGRGTFTAGTALQLGSTPGPIAVGDFNGDGKADLAVVLPSNSTVAIFLGNGDGTFTSSTSTVYTAPQPEGIVVADLNGDGLQDLAVLAKGSNNVTVLLGHGDGTFAPSNFSPASGSSPQSVVQADFNGDGIPDLAITNDSYTGGVTVLLGNGDGTFTAAPTIPTTAFAYSIAVGDFNQDGKPDLVVGGNGGTAVNVFLGNGDGTFAAAPNALTSSYVLSLGVADMNGDGKPDLIALDANTYKLTVLLGNGDGTFTTGATQSIASQPEATVLGDWNSDGVPDVAVVNYYGSSVTTVMTQLEQKVLAAANNISPNGTGQHVIAATYPGDISYTGSTSGTVSLTAQPGATVVTVTPSAPSVFATQQLTVNVAISATISAGYPAPTGTVILTSGSYSSSPVTLSGGNGVVNVPASTLAAGTDTLTVSYTPDTSTYAGSTGSTTVTVSKATPNISISAATLVAVSVQVTDPVGTGVPSGTVTLTSGSYTSAAATLTSGSGNITVPAGTLPAGTDTVTINYTPDTASAPLYNSASVTRNISETQIAPTITWATPTAITYGTALSGTQLNATSSTPGTFSYSPAAGALLPAGPVTLSVTFTPTDTVTYQSSTSSVSLMINKAPLSISVNNASRVYGTTNPAFSGMVTGAVNGDTFTEAFSTSATTSSPAGIYAIVPSVSGANLANYTVAGTNGTLTIAPAPTTTAFALSNQNLTLTATVTSASGVPTGQVGFYAGGTLLGTGMLNGDSTSISLTSFPSGDVSLIAQYEGDGNFAASSSASVPVLTFTPSSTSLTVSSGGAVTDNFSLSVVAGYAGTLQFSCTGLPQDATCSFQPASITFSGGTATATTVLTVSTGGLARSDSTPLRNKKVAAVRWAEAFLPGMFFLLVAGRRRRTGWLRNISLLLVLGAVIGFTGCGGNGSSSPTQQTNPVTPSGHYSIQVIATAPTGASQSTSVSVTVQ